MKKLVLFIFLLIINFTIISSVIVLNKLTKDVYFINYNTFEIKILENSTIFFNCKLLENYIKLKVDYSIVQSANTDLTYLNKCASFNKDVLFFEELKTEKKLLNNIEMQNYFIKYYYYLTEKQKITFYNMVKR